MKLLLATISLVSALAVTATPQTETSSTRIISYNVWVGFEKKPERKVKWLKWMKEQQADIVALQELNGYTPEKLAKDAATWGHSHSVLLKENGFPTGLTSSLPITETKRLREGFHHGLLRCRTGGLIVYVIHFHPSDWKVRVREAKLLLADVATLPAEDQQKVILIGDFNGFSPFEKKHLEKDGELVSFFKELDARYGGNNLNQGKLDYGGIQAFHDTGYVDLIHEKLPSDAPYPGTFPTGLRADEDMGRNRRLDYAFAPEGLSDKVLSAEIIGNSTTAQLSDHYPIVLDLATTKP